MPFLGLGYSPLSAPLGVYATAQPGDTSAVIHWQPPTDGQPVTGYTVACSDGTTMAAVAAAVSLTYGPLPYGTYTFTVRAANVAQGAGPLSGASNAVTIRPRTPTRDGAFTEVAICNLALMRCGIGRTITSLTEASTEARACATAYPLSADSLLSGYPWRFATKTVQLAQVAGLVSAGEAAYALPADCLTVQALVPAVAAGAPPQPWQPFGAAPSTLLDALNAHRLEALEDGGSVLWTYASVVTLRYTARVPSSRFHATFADALCWRIAMEVGMPLSVKPELRQQAAQLFQAAYARACTVSANQGRDAQAQSEFIRVRGG